MDNNSQNKPSGKSSGGNKPGGQGGQRRSSNNSKNTGRKRRYNNKRRGPKAEAKSQGSGQDGSENNNNNRPRRNNRNNRNKSGSKNVSTNKVVQHYDTLLEQHLTARKKYYELYFRADPNQKRKLDKKFISTVESLRNYEEGLKPWQKEQLDKRVNFGKLDTTFSENYQLDPFECDEVPTEYDDIHLTEAQKSRTSYTEDTEESSGTIEDYKKYKGIVD